MNLYLIKRENIMKFKIGDKVRVIRRVDSENGWNNCWVSGMSESIGRDFYVTEVGSSLGVRLSDGVGYGNLSYAYPPSALILLPEFETKKCTPFEAPNYSEELNIWLKSVKYQYLTADKWESCENPKLKDLCISLLTEVDYDAGAVFWSVSFKHPKDQFNKAIARQSLLTKQEYVLPLGKKFSHTEIVFKILSYILYTLESKLTDDYKEFVWVLINRYISLINDKRA